MRNLRNWFIGLIGLIGMILLGLVIKNSFFPEGIKINLSWLSYYGGHGLILLLLFVAAVSMIVFAIANWGYAMYSLAVIALLMFLSWWIWPSEVEYAKYLTSSASSNLDGAKAVYTARAESNQSNSQADKLRDDTKVASVAGALGGQLGSNQAAADLKKYCDQLKAAGGDVGKDPCLAVFPAAPVQTPQTPATSATAAQAPVATITNNYNYYGNAPAAATPAQTSAVPATTAPASSTGNSQVPASATSSKPVKAKKVSAGNGRSTGYVSGRKQLSTSNSSSWSGGRGSRNAGCHNVPTGFASSSVGQSLLNECF